MPVSRGWQPPMPMVSRRLSRYASPSTGEAIYIVLDQKPKSVELTRLRRVRNILANPQAALVVDHYEEDWRDLRYVLVSCLAEVLSGDEDEAAVAVSAVAGQISAVPWDGTGRQPGDQAHPEAFHCLELQWGVVPVLCVVTSGRVSPPVTVPKLLLDTPWGAP